MSTLAKPPIYDQVQREMLQTATPGNPKSIMRPSSLLLILQPVKVFWECRQSFRKYFFDKFWQLTDEEKSLIVETCIKTHY